MKRRGESQKRKLATITITAPAAVHTMFSARDKENVPKNGVLALGINLLRSFVLVSKNSCSLNVRGTKHLKS